MFSEPTSKTYLSIFMSYTQDVLRTFFASAWETGTLITKYFNRKSTLEFIISYKQKNRKSVYDD